MYYFILELLGKHSSFLQWIRLCAFEFQLIKLVLQAVSESLTTVSKITIALIFCLNLLTYNESVLFLFTFFFMKIIIWQVSYVTLTKIDYWTFFLKYPNFRSDIFQIHWLIQVCLKLFSSPTWCKWSEGFYLLILFYFIHPVCCLYKPI